jgi:hypothetical protein
MADTELIFTGTRREADGREGVEFVGDRGGETLRFWITGDALDALADDEPAPTLAGEFDRWIEVIWSVAQDKVANGSSEQDGRFILREDDFLGG